VVVFATVVVFAIVVVFAGVVGIGVSEITQSKYSGFACGGRGLFFITPNTLIVGSKNK